ncbi:unnamed protein product [Caenorhabditis bovis]|uniref:phosphatidylinositol-3,5-bisphosphate 3-phosphatase n=1 Tax=Caenorhabditis bovis TaxID=2654633 RepID=A0A8S1ELT1_9PELO|nr:unnamed protein product [Caenorhabditis bovis]
MTGTSTAPIDIGTRSDRTNSETNHDDMSFISPHVFGASYVNLSHNDFSGNPDYDDSVVHEPHAFVDLNAPTSSAPLVSRSSNTTSSDEPRRMLVLDRDIPLLPGEQAMPVNSQQVCPVEGGTVMLTNFRLLFLTDGEHQSIFVFTLMELELTDFRDPNQVIISMKGGRVRGFTFESYERAFPWHRQLLKIVSKLNRGHSVAAIASPTQAEAENMEPIEVFAWKFAEAVESSCPEWLRSSGSITPDVTKKDYDRLGMNEDFRISAVNEGFQVCESYPERIIVPSSMTDEEIKEASSYRGLNRFPAVVWRCKSTRAVLMRSAQPQVGFLSWRNYMDEKIVATLTIIECLEGKEKKQFVIMDARTYAAAFANRARSGGFENTEYYQQAKLDFLGLPNIHTVRNSFIAMRNLLHSGTHGDQLLASLQNTGWLQNLSNLLFSSASCADYLSKGHSVLVHCSDGWDRTTQIVSLAKIMLDDYYRTIEGFEELIRREWLAFGHKFYDRQQRNWDAGERSPIFLQFLEAVRHLQREQPTAFQFTHAYLIKLAQHSYSGLFGTFLFNSQKEMREALTNRDIELVEIWRYLGDHHQEFVNQSYDDLFKGPLKSISFSVINLRVWHEVFSDDVERYMHLYSPNPSATQSPSQPSGNSALTPSKENVERQSSSGYSSNSSGIIKSRSSESINSINNEGVNVPLNTHSGSNGAIPSLDTSMIIASPPSESFCFGMSTSTHQHSLAWNQHSSKIDDMLDCDGLIKFEDEEQEIQRRKNNAMKNELKRKENIIEDLKNRQRNFSEKTSNGSIGYTTNGSRLNSFCDTDDCKSNSDISVVEASELPDANKGWEMNGTNCKLCNMEFSKMSPYQEDRAHHCRNCGLFVCFQCSQHYFHVFEEGQSRQKRVCDKCYKKMCSDKISRSSSLDNLSDNDCRSFRRCISPSSHSLNRMPTQPQCIRSSCKGSSHSVASAHNSPGEFCPHQAVKG